MNIAKHYNNLKKELGGASDTAVALVMIAEQLHIMNNRAVCLDGEQVCAIKGGLNGIAEALAGVGQMVGKLGVDCCAEIVTNGQEGQ